MAIDDIFHSETFEVGTTAAKFAENLFNWIVIVNRTANIAIIVGAALERTMWTAWCYYSENNRGDWRDRAIVGLEKKVVLEA